MTEMQTITIVRKSMMTGELNEMRMRLDPDDMTLWREGALIQVAFPYLTNEEREFLMTGMSIEEQQAFFVESGQ